MMERFRMPTLRRVGMKNIIILMMMVFSSITAKTDSEMGPRPRITPSQLGKCFFKMIPEKYKDDNDKIKVIREPFGVAYCLAEDGDFQEMWKTSGWYAWRVFLSDDGHYLVRMGPWHRGRQAKKEDLGVAFYKDGLLLKEYSVVDLLKGPTQIARTVSHYFWLASEMPSPDSSRENELALYGYDFYLTTIEGYNFHFNAATGVLIEEKKVDLKPFKK